MVRVNLIDPRYLSDQHLVAEYYEIAMLVAYIRKYPDLLDIPENFSLGQGHMKFFKNKVLYLRKRHKTIISEMRSRGFRAEMELDITGLDDRHMKDWKPEKRDLEIVKYRLREKILIKNDGFYRYYGKPVSKEKMISIIESA